MRRPRGSVPDGASYNGPFSNGLVSHWCYHWSVEGSASACRCLGPLPPRPNGTGTDILTTSQADLRPTMAEAIPARAGQSP